MVEIYVHSNWDRPQFLPSHIASSDGIVTFVFPDDSRNVTQRRRVVESAAPFGESPCAQNGSGLATWWVAPGGTGRVQEIMSTAPRYLYAEIETPGNTTACEQGMLLGINVSEDQFQAYQLAVELFASRKTKSRIATSASPEPSASSTTTSSSDTVFKVVIGTLSVVVVVFVVVVAWFVPWRRRRARRQRAGTPVDGSVEHLEAAPPQPTVQRLSTQLVQDDNDRLVMRAASMSSLPAYSSESGRGARHSQWPATATPGQDTSPFADPEDPFASPEDAASQTVAQTESALASNVATQTPTSRHLSAVSAANTMVSATESLPEYMSMAVRPPSYPQGRRA